MAKAIIVFGSTMGNTGQLADAVEAGLKEKGIEVVKKNVSDASVEELKDYDLILLGSSTWGNGELQDDFVSFYEKMGEVNLEGKKSAAFGPGDSTYPQFCKAVDLLEEKLKERGAQIVSESFKVDGDVSSKTDDAQNWAKNIASSV
ncbi:MAG: flavodoxin [Candidatus Omnitrophica bacterium]|nr:flavodoxin [Candidatus Omnitrophota bacterium]